MNNKSSKTATYQQINAMHIIIIVPFSSGRQLFEFLFLMIELADFSYFDFGLFLELIRSVLNYNINMNENNE